jgi:hypothetical protein
MTLKERVAAPTPPFFRKIRMIGLALAAISGVLLTAPVSLPVSILSLAGYAGVAGGIMSVISQMAVENSLISKAGQNKNKSGKGKEVI